MGHECQLCFTKVGRVLGLANQRTKLGGSKAPMSRCQSGRSRDGVAQSEGKEGELPSAEGGGSASFDVVPGRTHLAPGDV